MAFNFEDELGGMDDASLMDILGFAPTGSPAQKSLPPVQPAAPSGGFLNAASAPSPVFSAPAPSPSVVGAPMAAPAPSPFVSPFNQGLEPSSAGVTFVPEGSEPPTIAVGRTEQPPSFDELMGYVMSGQPTMKAAGAPAAVSSSVPAYSPAPSPVYTQAPAASPAPTTAAAPSPMNLFGMNVTQDQLADLGVSAPAAPAPSPVQAPAPSTAAQAPAPTGHWESMGGGEGGGQSVWVEDKPKPIDQTLQYYQPFSGQISSALTKYMPKSGSDLYGSWHFDTPESRQVVTTTHPETGETSSGTVGMLDAAPRYQTDENGNPIGLNPDYGLKDTTGLVHGAQAVPIDKTHIKYTYSFFDPQTGKPVGNAVTQVVEQKQSASDLLAGLLMSAATSAIAGPMAGALGGGAMGAGLAGAALGGAQASVAGGDVLKGALTGGLGAGLGNVASGYINPAAAAAGQAVGGGTLGDIVSGAVKGAGTSATGALVSGKSIGDALLSGALGGGASAGIGSLVGQTGLPPELAKIAAPALTAAVLGKDPASAALNAAIGQVIGAAKTGGGAEAGAMTGGEADERKGVSEVTDLINNLAFAPTPSPAPAPAPTPAPAPAPSTDTGEDETESEEDKEGTEAAIDALTKGADTAASVSGEDLTKGTSDQTVQDLLDAGLTSEDTDTDSVINELTGNKSSGLSEQAKFLESNVEDADDIDQLLKDYAIDTGQLQGEYSNVGALDKDYTVGDTGKILDAGTNDLADQFLGGNLEEDYVVTDRGTVKSTYTGEEGTFDADGNWVPYTGGTGGVSGTSGTGGTGGTGGGTSTKTTTTTTPTAAKSGLDLNSLMAWMALAGNEEQAQAPQQQLFNLGQRKSLQDIFKDYYA